MMTRSRALFLTIASLLGVSLQARALPAASSPQVSNFGYMQTTAKDGKAAPLPLRHTDVKAQVSGFMASVRVTQEFHNPYASPIEAVYVFPLPHKAAVYAMTMTVGDRVIKGVIRKRQEARQIYEKAKREGKTASLLDQERPNIFTQAVANILPGDRILVELSYAESLDYRSGEYEFVFPMVVGPRYIPGAPLGQKGQGWSADTDRVPDASRITPALLKKGQRPGYDISLALSLEAGMEIKGLVSPSHKISVEREGTRAAVGLDQGDTLPNKDFVLRYRLAGQAPETALLTHKADQGGFFLMMIQPQADVTWEDVSPREYIFVVDTSGSMGGFPLQTAKAAMSKCLATLREGDRFNIISFAGNARALWERSRPADPSRIAEALSSIDNWSGGGGTEFIPALDLAIKAPRDPELARTILFISDGYIGYEAQVLAHLRKNLKDTNLFSLGIGSSVNRFLIDGMARIGMGEPFVILSDQDAQKTVDRLFQTVSRPVLTDIEIDWGGLAVEELSPQVLPDLFAQRPLFVVGRYSEAGEGTVRLTGRLAGRPYEREMAVTLPDRTGDDNMSLPYLWARRQIEGLMDIHATDEGRRKEAERAVTDLALEFSLMSQFTSFVAVDEVRRNEGDNITVPVAVPLADGVSEMAAPPQAFGLSGQGSGGGGIGSGTIGLGRLGTISRGAGGGGGGGGYGKGSVSLGGRAARAPVVVAGSAVIRGSLDKEIIRRVIRQHMAEVRYCYEQELQKNPQLQGSIVVQMVVSPTGSVTSATIISSTMNNKAVESGLTKRILRWRFPSPKGGGIVIINYPFLFQPSEK